MKAWQRPVPLWAALVIAAVPLAFVSGYFIRGPSATGAHVALPEAASTLPPASGAVRRPAHAFPTSREGLPRDERLALARTMIGSSDDDERRQGMGVMYADNREVGKQAAREAMGDPKMALFSAGLLLTDGYTGSDLELAKKALDDSRLSKNDREALTATVLGVMVRAGAPGARAFLEKALHSDDAMIRGATVGTIAAMPSDKAVPLLLEALGDPDPRIAENVVRALVGMHGGDARLGRDRAAWDAWWREHKTKAKPAAQ